MLGLSGVRSGGILDFLSRERPSTASDSCSCNPCVGRTRCAFGSHGYSGYLGDGLLEATGVGGIASIEGFSDMFG